jgi:hypothetical protein
LLVSTEVVIVGGAVQAGRFLDVIGVGSGFDELEQCLVLVHRLVGPAGNEAEGGGPDCCQPVPAAVDQVQDVRVGAVFEQDAVEVLVQLGEPDGVKMLKALAHLLVHCTGPGNRRRVDQGRGQRGGRAFDDAQRLHRV